MYKIKLFLCLTISVLCNGQFWSLNTINNLFSGFKDIITPNKDLDFIEDTFLNITDLVKKYGYKIEEHRVSTEDGYVLNFHRMPGNATDNIIFLMHGILDSSDSWVLQGPKNAFAYYLVDEGFDVWMGNARGNKYSSLHTTLNETQRDFWKFTWEEIGIYDLPAMIDYILEKTGKENLYYVGHSQGSTSFYVMNSLRPEYNNKVNMMFSLAPVSWMSHAKSPILKMLTTTYSVLEYFVSETYSNTDYLVKLQKFFCKTLPIGCDNLLQLIIGNDYKFIKPELMPVIFGHVPSSSSNLQLIHYVQLYSSGRFCRFDYGASENLVRYKQMVPPDYDLTNVKVPIIIFYSDNDWLSDSTDVSLLCEKLPNVFNTYYLERFNHFVYMYAGVARDLVYSNIVKEIRQLVSRADI